MDVDRRFWKGKRVCVTGGTGLLGYQVVRCLLDAGAVVRVLALAPRGPHPLQQEPGVEMAIGDVRDLLSVRRSVADCDVIFHAAGVVAVWGPALARVRDVHAIGTRNVLEAAPLGARVVLTSSVVTVGASIDQTALDEDSAFDLDDLKIDYVHAKRAAERLALDHAAQGGDVVVVNPGYLIGPDDFERSVMGRFCVRYWRGLLPVAPPGGVNLVDVRDVALGHLLAAEHGQAGRRYILGGANSTFAQFMTAMAETVGFRPRGTPVLPYWALTLLANVGELRSRINKRQPYPSLQHARLNRYHWFYRSDRAANELGYSSRSLAASLDDTFQWFSARKNLRPQGVGRWWMRPEAGVGRALRLDPPATPVHPPHASPIDSELLVSDAHESND